MATDWKHRMRETVAPVGSADGSPIVFHSDGGTSIATPPDSTNFADAGLSMDHVRDAFANAFGRSFGEIKSANGLTALTSDATSKVAIADKSGFATAQRIYREADIKHGGNSKRGRHSGTF